MAFQVVARVGIQETKPQHVFAGENTTRHELLTMYNELPQGNISIEEFEALALDRLRVLKGIEEYRLRNKPEDAVKARAKELIKKHLEGSCNEETARRDLLSHYVLRLAYARTPDLRKWFLDREIELFKIRFADLLDGKTDKEKFLARSGLKYSPMSEQEVEAIDKELRAVMTSQAVSLAEQNEIIAEGFYKVPFTAVPDLVAGRKVLVRAGFAAVSNRDLLSLVAQDFRAVLSKGLAEVNRRWKEMFPDNDTRLRPLVSGLSTRYLGASEAAMATVGARHGPLSAATVNAVSQRHFPLCMQNLVTQLNANHHLRHGGRQQLSLFLKSVGMPLEEALVFWRNAFSPVMPADKFDREHAYNIRHNYGKEGGRKDYTAHNCCSLVRMTGGPQEFHGCPYKRMDPASLRTALSRAGCDDKKAGEAVEKARAGHYQIACATAWEGIHKTELEIGVNHPAEYYSESKRLAEEKAAAAEKNGASQQQQQQKGIVKPGAPAQVAAA